MYIRRKVFSVAYDETTGEERLFSTTEIMGENEYLEKLYAEDEEKTTKKIRSGSNARIWMDKNLQTKKDREALIEAYDQEGPRNSHKLGKQAAKYGGAGAATGTAIAAGLGLNLLEKKSGRGAAEFLKSVGADKKIVKAALKNPKLAKAALITAAGAGTGAAGAGIAYVGTRTGRAIGKKLEDNFESSAHSSQKAADENKVASGKMSRDEFAQKYGKSIKESQRREFEKQKKYSEGEDEKKMSTRKKAAIGTGATIGTLGTGAAGIYGAKKLGEHLEKKAEDTLKHGVDEKGKAAAIAKRDLGKNLQKPGKWIARKLTRKG